MAELYDRSRPRARHPAGEIESYDREMIRAGNDDAAIRWVNHAPGYVVGDLANARRLFLGKYNVDAEWPRFSD
jgi:hypothetical protein